MYYRETGCEDGMWIEPAKTLRIISSCGFKHCRC